MPADFLGKFNTIKECDLVLVLGTALAVSPFNRLVDSALPEVPKVLINRENNAKFGYDFTKGKDRLLLSGNCDEVVQKIIRDCRW